MTAPKDWELAAARKRAEGDEDGALYEEGFGAFEEEVPRDAAKPEP